MQAPPGRAPPSWRCRAEPGCPGRCRAEHRRLWRGRARGPVLLPRHEGAVSRRPWCVKRSIDLLRTLGLTSKHRLLPIFNAVYILHAAYRLRSKPLSVLSLRSPLSREHFFPSVRSPPSDASFHPAILVPWPLHLQKEVPCPRSASCSPKRVSIQLSWYQGLFVPVPRHRSRWSMSSTEQLLSGPGPRCAGSGPRSSTSCTGQRQRLCGSSVRRASPTRCGL